MRKWLGRLLLKIGIVIPVERRATFEGWSFPDTIDHLLEYQDLTHYSDGTVKGFPLRAYYGRVTWRRLPGLTRVGYLSNYELDNDLEQLRIKGLVRPATPKVLARWGLQGRSL